MLKTCKRYPIESKHMQVECFITPLQHYGDGFLVDPEKWSVWILFLTQKKHFIFKYLINTFKKRKTFEF